MCVYNALSKQATIYYAESFQNMALYGFNQGYKAQLYLEPVVNFLFTVQDEIKPQLPVLKNNDLIFYDFISYHMERLDKLRKFEQSLGPFSEEKKGEIPEEEKKLIKQVINKFHMKNDIIGKIKPESLLVFHNSLNAGWRYLQTLQQKQSETRAIFDQYTGEFQEIEKYEKKLEKCKYYEGFYFHSIGKLKFFIKDNKNNDAFTHESTMLCLYKKEENIYYPYEYMIVCIDFEMQNGGKSDVEAFNELKNTFDFYFNNLFREGNAREKVTQIVNENTTWKETFKELSGIGKKLKGVLNKDWQDYIWEPGTEDSSD